MSRKVQNRNRWLNIRLTENEFLKVRNQFEKSTFLKMSEYSRSLLLGEPVKVSFRNQSMDDMMEELIILRQELNFIGHNFNQVVRKLNSFSEMPDAEIWKRAIIILKNQIEPCIVKVKGKINEYAEVWSQKSLVEKV